VDRVRALEPIYPLLAEWFGSSVTKLSEDDNLIELGLDSIRLMALASAFESTGVSVHFAELARSPQLRSWIALVEKRAQDGESEEGEGARALASAQTQATLEAAHARALGPFDLAPMQHAYWVGRAQGQELNEVTAHFYHEFDAQDIDLQRLQQAVRVLLMRHPQLRVVITDDGKQWIPPELRWPGLTVHDLRALSEADEARALEEIRERLSRRCMRIDAGEVFDVQLSQRTQQRARVHINLDMVAADALSLRILLADLAALYRAGGPSEAAALPAIRYSYREYLESRTREQDSDKRVQASAYWQERLTTLPSAPALPMLAARQRARTAARVVRRHQLLSREDKHKLFRRAHRQRLTPALVLCAAYCEIIYAFSGESTFLINVPLFDRTPVHPDVGLLVGDFTGSVLLAADLSEVKPFFERARDLQRQFLEDALHAAYAGVEVLRDLRRREGGRSVLAPVVFTSALNLGELFSEGVRAVLGEPAWIISQGPQVWIDAQVTELDGGLLINWDAAEDLFPDGVLDAMFDAYVSLVTSLLEDGAAWERPVGAVLPKVQLCARAATVNLQPLPAARLQDGFWARAAADPARTALVFGESGQLSYGDLAARAARVAAALTTFRVQVGDAVAIQLPRGPEQVSAVLGVLLAGACYVPIEMSQPRARRDRILSLAGVKIVLTTEQLAAEYGYEQAWRVRAMSIGQALASTSSVVSPPACSDQMPAYILFTSGSTGEPKGVMISHRSAMNTIADLNERFSVGPDDRFLALSSFAFDLSVYDVFGALSVGAAVVLLDEPERAELDHWQAQMTRHGVTVLNCVPAAFSMLLGDPADRGRRALERLRVVLLGGDWVGVELPQRLHEWVPGCRFAGLGGTTETAIHSTVCEVSGGVPLDWSSIPYGLPLRNVVCRVVDRMGRDCPDWVQGELWIGGEGVALGYVGDAERTAQRFVVHDQTRFYRTGDLARYRPEGLIEFLGRADTQIKLRGFRVELAEIEATLARVAGMQHAVVHVLTGAQDSKQLVAVCAPDWQGAAPEEPSDLTVQWAGPSAAIGQVLQTEATRLFEEDAGDQHPDDALERSWVAYVLGELIGDVDRGCKVAEGLERLIALWRTWLRAIAPAPSLSRLEGTPRESFARELIGRLPDLRAIVRGELDPLSLLDDPVLAPEVALLRLRGAQPACTACAERLIALQRELRRPVRVAVLGARSGRAAAQLRGLLTAQTAELTLFDASDALLQRARERLSDFPAQLNYQVLRDGLLSEPLVAAFDVVWSFAALHTFADPGEALRVAALLLCPRGELLAVEQSSLGPMGLISAAIPTRGFETLDPERRSAGSPLLSVAAWCQLMQAAGFLEARVEVFSEEPSLRLYARRGSAVRLEFEAVRQTLATQLPAYMRPERYWALPRFPMNRNGKLDRQAVRALVSRCASAETGSGVYEPPLPGLEHSVAQLWQALLRVARVGRQDDFFALGGDSLIATRLTQRLREAGIVGGRVSSLFLQPKLADYVRTLRSESTVSVRSRTLQPDPSTANRPFPLTDVQRAYWIGRQRELALGSVGAHYYSEFDGEQLDVERLERALQRLVERHPMLRSVVDRNGQQRVLEACPPVRIETLDARGWTAQQAQEALLDLRTQMSHQVLDPSRFPFFDLRAVHYSEGAAHKTRLAVSLDNLALDGLSMMIFFSELSRLYVDPAAELPAPVIDVTFKDYVEQAGPMDVEGEASRAYWLERIPTLPPAPQLPLIKDPSSMGRPRFERHTETLPDPLWRALKRRAREYGVTPATLLLGVYAEVLGGYSSSQHLTVNLTLFDRREVHPHIRWVLGDFTSLLLVAHEPQPGEAWLARIRRLQAQLWRDLDHRDASAVWVMRELSRQRGGASTMPFVFTCAVGLDDSEVEVSMDPVPGFPERVWGVSQTPQVLLDLQVYEGRDGALRQQWDAVVAAFPAGLVAAMAQRYVRLLAQLVELDWGEGRPPWVRRPLPAAVSSAWEVGEWASANLHRPFFERARAEPERPALWCDGRGQTRAELARSALRYAAALQQRGVNPGDVVVVSLPKGPEQIAAVLGVLAAGATYVPMGIDQPVVRRERVFWASGAVCTIDSSFAQGPLPEPLAEPCQIDPAQIAYVIFTSGSTGEPKGVEVTHRAAANTIADINQRFGVSAQDRGLAVSALDFDLSVYDVFGILGAGGSLVLIGEDERRDAQRWQQLVMEHGVTLWNSVPVLLDMLLTTASSGGVRLPLRLALISGDWIALDLPQRFAQVTQAARLIALGGATEASIWSNCFDATQGAPPDWPSIPYGTPLRNQYYRVVNELGEDCPDWVPGELWIGGSGVAAGYRGDPERSAQRFVTDGSGRWYRTGDVGRYRPDGLLEFLGRKDSQVKIRGHRTELGEIDAALVAQPDIKRALSVAVGPTTNKRLVAFVVPSARDIELDVDGLRRRLAERLPEHAVPSQIRALDALPVTANGKVDRAALQQQAEAVPSPTPSQHTVNVLQTVSRKHAEVSGASHVSEIEQCVVEACRELLPGAAAVNIDQDFFALGGDSLLATRLVVRLQAAGLQGASIGGLFREPVLRRYAANLERGTSSVALPVLLSNPAHAYEPFDATEVQRAYEFGRKSELVLGGVGSHYYCEFDEPLADLVCLSRAVRRLLQRHPMLRAVFDGRGRQRVLQNVPHWTVAVDDVRGSSLALANASLMQMREEMSHQVFDPTRWPLFDVRAVHYQMGEQPRTRIGVSLDNLILDGLSMMIFFSELQRLREEPDAILPDIQVTFRDYLSSVTPDPQAVQRAQAHFRQRLHALPLAPQLPRICDPAELKKIRFERRIRHWPSLSWQRLRERAQRAGVTPSMVLLAVYAEALGAWSEDSHLTVNLTLFERQEIHPHVDRVLGDFTSLLLADYRPEARESWLERLRGLQARVWSDLDHRAVSGMWLMRQLFERDGAAGAAMPVVFTSALGLDRERSAQLQPPLWSISQTPQVWLDHQVLEDALGLRLTWDAVTGLFPEGLIDLIMQRQLELLSCLVEADWNSAAPAPAHSMRPRRALIHEAQPRPRQAPSGPQGSVEAWVADLFTEVLPTLVGPQALTREQGFFALGGDSLLATRLIADIRQRIGIEVSLRAFFAEPTIAGLAKLLVASGYGRAPGTGNTTQPGKFWEEGEL